MCHHEWEASGYTSKCDWCKAKGYILQMSTGLEKLYVKHLRKDKFITSILRQADMIPKPESKVKPSNRPHTLYRK